MSSKAQRLAAAVKARRDQLELSQIDVWQAGGPSNTTLTNIENGHMSALNRKTAAKLDKGLRWVAGSARRVFDLGADPEPLPDLGDLSDLLDQVEQSGLSEETKAHIIRALEAQAAEAGRDRGVRGA